MTMNVTVRKIEARDEAPDLGKARRIARQILKPWQG